MYRQTSNSTTSSEVWVLELQEVFLCGGQATSANVERRGSKLWAGRLEGQIWVGPINVDVSRSGVGVCAGAGPFRAGVDAKGRRYTNVRGPFGIYNRQYYGSADRGSAENRNVEALKTRLLSCCFRWLHWLSIVQRLTR